MMVVRILSQLISSNLKHGTIEPAHWQAAADEPALTSSPEKLAYGKRALQMPKSQEALSPAPHLETLSL
jgi:hypothetical protein